MDACAGRHRRFGADRVGVRRATTAPARAAASARARASSPPPTAAPDGAQQGGDLTVIAASDVDYIDPGAAYYQFTLHGHLGDAVAARRLRARPTSRSRRRCSPTEAPTVSDDGKTITYTIRDDVKFSPAGRPRRSTAADVKYAIERSLLPGVPNGYVQTYLAGVEGIDEAVKEAQDNPTGGAPDISGITAPDDTTLEIKLTNTSSLGVIGALTLPVSAPVPEEYAKQYDAENPSTYGEHQLATGPYMIDERTRRTRRSTWFATRTGRRPTRDFRPAYLDDDHDPGGLRRHRLGGARRSSPGAPGQRRLLAPPSVIKQAATAGEPGQLTLTPSGGNRYIALNTQEPPFDDINVRKAVIAGSNRTDLRNTRGGELVGPVATHYPAARLPRLRGSRRTRGHRPGLPRQPRRRSRGLGRVLQEGRDVERQVRGPTARSPWSVTTRRPGPTPPRCSRASSRRWASTSTSRR